jgi:hypothetical protein
VIANADPVKAVAGGGCEQPQVGGRGWGTVRVRGLMNTVPGPVEFPAVVPTLDSLAVVAAETQLGAAMGAGVGDDGCDGIGIAEEQVAPVEQRERVSGTRFDRIDTRDREPFVGDRVDVSALHASRGSRGRPVPRWI